MSDFFLLPSTHARFSTCGNKKVWAIFQNIMSLYFRDRHSRSTLYLPEGVVGVEEGWRIQINDATEHGKLAVFSPDTGENF